MSELSALELADPLPPSEVALTPGAILRTRREAQGLSVEDIADILRFSRRQIEALERDDYASLPGSTLVRGFVRSYSKLLKIAPEPLLAAINPEVPAATAEVRPPTNIGAADDGQRNLVLPSGRLISIVLVVLALLGVGLYFLTASDSPPPTPASLAPARPAGTTTLAAPSNVVASSADGGATNVIASSAMPPSSALIFEFEALSWVEVRDATQKIVYVGEYPKGTRQVVEGLAPFQVWIGKASAVRLTYGERSIDLKPYTREEVARFVVE